jgi:hypothetical protein
MLIRRSRVRALVCVAPAASLGLWSPPPTLPGALPRNLVPGGGLAKDDPQTRFPGGKTAGLYATLTSRRSARVRVPTTNNSTARSAAGPSFFTTVTNLCPKFRAQRPAGGTISRRRATSDRRPDARNAAPSPRSTSRPSSCNANSGVPACTCQLAQV